MNLQNALKQVHKHIEKKQDPDKVEAYKQWDEFGYLKGWQIECTWDGKKGEYNIGFDITNHYTRVIGDLDLVPDFVAGTHQKFSYDK